MGTAAKRCKLAVECYPCHTCLEDRASSLLPDYNPTETCEHLINTCTRCLRQWIAMHLGNKPFTPHIKCPQCDEKMTRRDVELAVTKKAFERFDELERKYIAENTPGWRWCLAVDCNAGQVHESPKPEEVTKPEEAPKSKVKTSAKKRKVIKTRKPAQKPKPDIFKCNACGAEACVMCDRPWHSGETCAEYQARTKDRLQEEDKSLALIQKNSRKCPKCSKNIEKNGGCRHMLCTQCNTEFCWLCMEIINRNGRYCGCVDNPPNAFLPW